MPYLTYFNLSDHPFALTPTTAAYFPGMVHQEILQSVRYAIDRGEGIIKVSGEVGTGKTLLCRILLDNAGEGGAAVAYLNYPKDDTDWLVRAVCREFDVELDDCDDPYEALNRFLIQVHAQGRQAIIFVDEAQALGERGLEAIRLLSNLETDTRKLLQIVMFGQPELDRLLRGHQLRQVAQRINFAFETQPLTREESVSYVRHRLKMASHNPDAGTVVFENNALKLIASAGMGNPRMMHILADKSMLAAYGEGADRVARRHVRAAIREARGLSLRKPIDRLLVPWWRRPAPAFVTATILVSSVTVVSAALYIALDQRNTGLRPWLTDTVAVISDRVGE